jgi:hypothetical protein
VATDHFENHPKWDPAVTSITKISPGPMGVRTTARLVRIDRSRRVEGSMEVTEYEPADGLAGDDGEEHSTKLSQLALLGVKCNWIRGCSASKFLTAGWVWVP